MKSFIVKHIPYVFLIAVWFLFDRSYYFNPESKIKILVFTAAFLISLFLIRLFEKPFLRVLPGVLVAIAVGIYNIEYIFFYLPVFFIIVTYLEINKASLEKDRVNSRNNDVMNYLMIININFIVAIVIFSFIKLINYPDDQPKVYGFSISYHSVMLIVLLLILYFSGISKDKKNSKNGNKNKGKKKEVSTDKLVNNLNVVCLATFAVNIFAYYSCAYHNDGRFRIMLFPWYVYVLIVVYNNDSNLTMFLEKIEDKIERFVNSKR